MTLLMHQLRTDLTHQRRWLWGWLLLIGLQASLAWMKLPNRELWVIAQVAVLILKLDLLLVITIQAVGADDALSDTAFWRTRPLLRRTLFTDRRWQDDLWRGRWRRITLSR